MNKPIKKIFVILILIILLPALSFSVYEVLSFNENEEVIREIYTNQLEAILFSVNQYSDDVVSGWSDDIKNILKYSPVQKDTSVYNKCKEFFQLNRSVRRIVIIDSSDYKYITSLPREGVDEQRETVEKIISLAKENEKTIRRLFTYSRSGYGKIEPVNTHDILEEQVHFFIIDGENNSKNVCALLINSRDFINSVLGPKIREIAQEKFIISASSGGRQTIWGGRQSQITTEIFRELWLFPNYKIGISPIGKSIDGLVKERTTKSLILILLLTLVLVGAVFFIFRLIKKEVQLAQTKTDFVSNVSHELRTPLALITMFSETLEMNRVRTEEKKQEYYKIISQEANRLSRIVNSILSFSKIEAGRRIFNLERIELNSAIESILTNYEFHFTNKGFKWSFENDGENIFISADKEAVSEAFINLLDNAIKYSDDNKEIRITTGRENTNAYISVRDYGIGISEENQKKIFEKFYRETTGFVHNTKGTGLGLTIVKHIMDAHKGRINLESKKGEGSTFTLNFPLVK
ncbi:MAG: ATP-binding protein [bacterium]